MMIFLSICIAMIRHYPVPFFFTQQTSIAPLRFQHVYSCSKYFELCLLEATTLRKKKKLITSEVHTWLGIRIHFPAAFCEEKEGLAFVSVLWSMSLLSFPNRQTSSVLRLFLPCQPRHPFVLIHMLYMLANSRCNPFSSLKTNAVLYIIMLNY